MDDEQPRSRRQIAVIAAACLGVVLVVGGGTILAKQFGGDAGQDSREAVDAWDEIGAPWSRGDQVHYLGRTARLPGGVASIAATADAAVILHDRTSPEYGDDDEYIAPGTGTVSALFADGELRSLGDHVVGVPLSDPLGHLAAWNTLGADERIGVVVFDTRKREVLHRNQSGARVLAVDGDHVYLGTDQGPVVWSEGTSEAPTPLGAGVEPEDWLLDVAGNVLLVGSENDDGGEVALRSVDGTRIAPVPEGAGSFSPDGAHLTVHSYNDEMEEAVQLWNVTARKDVPLQLPAGTKAVQAQWSSSGQLVVAVVDGEEYDENWDDALGVTSYACKTEDGTCHVIAGGPRVVGDLLLYESSGVGQFGALMEGAFS